MGKILHRCCIFRPIHTNVTGTQSYWQKIGSSGICTSVVTPLPYSHQCHFALVVFVLAVFWTSDSTLHIYPWHYLSLALLGYHLWSSLKIVICDYKIFIVRVSETYMLYIWELSNKFDLNQTTRVLHTGHWCEQNTPTFRGHDSSTYHGFLKNRFIGTIHLMFLIFLSLGILPSILLCLALTKCLPA